MARHNPLVKPFLKWAGGKRQLLPEIKKYIPKDINNYTYYEPFMGAGAVLFDLQPKKAVINDFNTQLILTYTVIKENVEELIIVLKNYKNMNDEKYYYEIRNLDRDSTTFNTLTNTEKAARLIFLNKTCFNGLYRVNSQGLFNVPYGRYKNPAICEELVLRQISNYLNTNEIKIVNVDFEQAVLDAANNSFIYFDPPYHSQNKTNFTGYHADGFGEEEQERLRNVMIKMTRRGAKCLLSNSDTEYIRELYDYDRFEIIPVQAKRTINSDSAGRGNVNEVLIKNW
ncbi:MAG: DNA adenine methylase [Spirochaetaceae bacterium]|jgi:DNA adenine methylase|nr:DNA adenine methylase [Spirochaetaceae bacterium]